MKDEEIAAAKKKGDPVHVPTRVRRGHRVLQRRGRRQGPQARRRDDRRHLPRQDHEVERPGDRPGRTRREAARAPTSRSATAPTSRARPSASPTFLAAYSHGVEERPRRRQDGQVADGHRRQGQRRRRRLRQAERRRGRLRRAGLRAREQLHVRDREEQVRQLRRADAGVDLGGRRRPDGPGRPALQRDRRARRPGLPDRRRARSCSSTRTCARPACPRSKAQAGQGVARLRARATARAWPRSSSTRRCRTAIHTAGPGEGRRPDLQRPADQASS